MSGIKFHAKVAAQGVNQTDKNSQTKQTNPFEKQQENGNVGNIFDYVQQKISDAIKGISDLTTEGIESLKDKFSKEYYNTVKAMNQESGKDTQNDDKDPHSIDNIFERLNYEKKDEVIDSAEFASQFATIAKEFSYSGDLSPDKINALFTALDKDGNGISKDELKALDGLKEDGTIGEKDEKISNEELKNFIAKTEKENEAKKAEEQKQSTQTPTPPTQQGQGSTPASSSTPTPSSTPAPAPVPTPADTEVKAEGNTTDEKLTDIDKKLDGFEKGSADANSKIDDLMDKEINGHELTPEQKKDYDDKEKLINDKTKEISDKDKIINDQNTQITKLNGDLTTVTAALNKAEDELGKMEVPKAPQKSGDAKKDGEAQKNYDQAKKAYDAKKKEVEQRKTDKANIEGQLKAAQTTKDQAIADKEQLTSDITKLEQEKLDIFEKTSNGPLPKETQDAITEYRKNITQFQKNIETAKQIKTTLENQKKQEEQQKTNVPQ